MNFHNKEIPLFKIRCSAIGKIMSNPQGGSPMDKYNKVLKSLREEEEKYDAMKTKDGVRGQQKWDKILQLRDEVVELEKNKDTVILSDTCLSYVEDWIKENVYQRRKLLKTDAIEKGIECEKEAVDIVNYALGTSFKKSKYDKGEKMENEWCTGHEDIDDKTKKETWDTKVCQSFDTFPLIKEMEESDYERQGQGYMWLKGEDYTKHHIVKVLVNTPAHQIQQKLFYTRMALDRKYNGNLEYIDPEYQKEAKSLFMQHVFDKQVIVQADGTELKLSDEEVIPYEDRIRVSTVERDNDKIESIIKRVEEIRAYLLQLGFIFIS